MLYCLSSKVSLKVDVSFGQGVTGCKYKRPWEFRGCNICVPGGNLLNGVSTSQYSFVQKDTFHFLSVNPSMFCKVCVVGATSTPVTGLPTRERCCALNWDLESHVMGS